MSSQNPNPLVAPPAGSVVLGKITLALQDVGGYVGLAGQLIPLIEAAAEGIKAEFQPGQVIDFQIELSDEMAALLNAYATDSGDGETINAELVRQGQPPLVFATPQEPDRLPTQPPTAVGPQPAPENTEPPATSNPAPAETVPPAATSTQPPAESPAPQPSAGSTAAPEGNAGASTNENPPSGGGS